MHYFYHKHLDNETFQKKIRISKKAKNKPTLSKKPNSSFPSHKELKKAKIVKFGLKKANMSTLLSIMGFKPVSKDFEMKQFYKIALNTG